MSQVSESTKCGRHAQIPATQYCAQCAMPLCDSCARPEGNGAYKCPVCSVSARVPGTSRVPEALRPRIPGGSPLVAMPCAVHAEMKTTVRCDGCGAYVCETCDFKLPSNLHVCPTCAMSSPAGLSSSRKKLVVAGFLLAVWSTVGMLLLVTGFFAESGMSATALGLVLSILVLMPSLGGLASSLSAQESRLHNPIALWVAVIWNSLVVLGFIALTIVGLMMGG